MNMQRRFWRCHVCNDIHYGVYAPEYCPTCGMRNAFVLCDRKEATHFLEGVKDKNAWRCGHCPDMHLGAKPLLLCSSCSTKKKYLASGREEMTRATEGADHAIATSKEVMAAWDDFADRNGKIKVWEERESVLQLSFGVLENVKNKGLKYCPCRVTTGEVEKDLKLVCPCNFLAQQTWKEYGECWCGLFVKR